MDLLKSTLEPLVMVIGLESVNALVGVAGLPITVTNFVICWSIILFLSVTISPTFILPYALFGLLTTIYHWNNAEVGSQYFTRRVPSDNYQAEVQDYLNFFAVA